VREVTRRLAPGVRELRKTTSPLDHVLATVVDVTPDARSSLRSLKAATPQLNPLLSTVTTVAPQLGSISRQATEALKCIRPYTPDIMSFFSTWGDALVSGDGRDKYFRAAVQSLLPATTNLNAYDTAAAVKAFPGTRYGFPQPPGYNAGQPWFLPECGAGPDALDPALDPEARSFNPLMRLPAEATSKRKGTK
jgi:ABC-type transporter Mla subunit MlaD